MVAQAAEISLELPHPLIGEIGRRAGRSLHMKVVVAQSRRIHGGRYVVFQACPTARDAG